MKTEQEMSPGESVLLLIFTLGFFILIFAWSFWWMLLLSPVYFLGTHIMIKGLTSDPTPKKPGDKIFSTTLLTVQDNRKPCKVIVREEEILVTSRGVPDIHIPMERLEGLLFKDESVPDKAMAGFGIDYTDHGSARLMFFNDGLFPVHNTKKAVETILKAHQDYFKGCDITPLQAVDLTPNRVDSVVHRYK